MCRALYVLDNIQYGQEVHDMHNALPSPAKLFGQGVVQSNYEEYAISGGAETISGMLATRALMFSKQTAKKLYETNKALVLLQVNTEQEDGKNHYKYVFAFSIDDSRLGFVEYTYVG